MDTEYRAVYMVRNDHKGARQHDGALDNNLETVEQSAAGIVKNWKKVTSATVYGYPSRRPVVTYGKGGVEIRYATA